MISAKTVFCHVEKSAEAEVLISKCHMISDVFDVVAQIKVDISEFMIEEAKWQVRRSPTGQCTQEIDLKEMLGNSGYIQGKKALMRISESPEGALKKYMMIQCINGLVQGETAVYKERGFKERSDYDRYWDELEKNGCRMYTYPSTEDERWMDYVESIPEKGTVFHRTKHCIVKEDKEGFVIMGDFNDSYHHLAMSIYIDGKTEEIKDCNIQFLRAPGSSCFTNHIHSSKMIGKKIGDVVKADIVNWLGRGEGCYHLVDICVEMVNIFKS